MSKLYRLSINLIKLLNTFNCRNFQLNRTGANLVKRDRRTFQSFIISRLQCLLFTDKDYRSQHLQLNIKKCRDVEFYLYIFIYNYFGISPLNYLLISIL